MSETPPTLFAGSAWLRLHARADGAFALEAGHGAERVARLTAPLGVRWYRQDTIPDGERAAAWTAFEPGPDSARPWTLRGRVTDRTGAWEAVTRVGLDDDARAFRLVTTFTRRGPAQAASVRVHVDFAASPARAFDLVPGSLYHGNRADAVVPRGYAPLLTPHELGTREIPAHRRLIADIPRLDASTWWTAHLWGHQPASATACVFDPAARAGVHLGYARTEGARVLGLIFTADPDAAFHRATVENPCVRERRYRHCRWENSPDRAHLFADGEQALIDLRLAPVEAADIPAFVTSWQPERARRRAGLAPGGTGRPARTPDIMPRSHAAALALDWNDRHLWNADERFYQTIALKERQPRQYINGWGSGTMTLAATFRLGTPAMRDRVRATVEFLLRHAQAPTGLFYGARMTDGTWAGADGDLDHKWALNALTPRRTTDTVYFGLDLADALRATATPADADLAERLDAALRRACDALVRVWRREGEIPFLLDPRTERVVWPGGFGGARAINCLVRSAARWHLAEHLEVARALADRYVREGLARGETWGGPADVVQGTADNESLTALADGLVALHAATGEPAHLAAAIHAADLLATWALDEEVAFPADSLLARHGIQPFGALVASTQNCWGTPGLCVNSGRFLLALHERTGEPRFLDLLSDIVRVPLQMMVRPGQDWGPRLEVGQMTECASFNDVPHPFGDAYGIPATWPVNAMLLAAVELPSIYVDANARRVWRFDHLAAELSADGAVKVSNPTAFPATARVLWRDGREATATLAPQTTRHLSPAPLSASSP